MAEQEEKPTLLIVDDAPENIQILKAILGDGHTVKVATSGEVALKIAVAGSAPPDLILLDVMMPGMDGYEVCRRLKADERSRNVPVIFVSARSETIDEERGFAMGAADYISKPVSPPIVRARVKTHLALYNRARHLEAVVNEQTSYLLSKTVELEETRREIIRRLGRAAEYRDNETGMHVIRLSYYVQLLARRLGLADFDVELMTLASPMHDVGKIGIPDHILLKPGRLTPEEFVVIRRHPQIGAEIIGEHQDPLLRLAATISLTHHEKWNGEGYPAGLSGEAIPLAGRITAVADVFDALTSHRPYKQAWDIEAAFSFLEREAGQAFDPRLVPLFIGARAEIEEIMANFRDQLIH